MILIGIGANLPSPEHGTPLETCKAAVRALDDAGLAVSAQSTWYESMPVPVSDQPWFINGVVRVETDRDVPDVLALLHSIEADFGRVRAERNAPRILDMDLLCYGQRIVGGDGEGGAVVPHPRMAERAFVLKPLAELAPEWRHPVSGLPISALIEALPADQVARPLGSSGA